MGLLVALGAVPVAAAGLILLRWRALQRTRVTAARCSQPLTPGEIRRLRRWSRRLRRAIVLVGIAYLGLVAASLAGDEPPPERAAAALALLGVACLAAAMIQFSERCPRCGYNLGFQSRLAVPSDCERCGGGLA